MTKKMYAIFDKRVGEYVEHVVAVHAADIVRNVTLIVKARQSVQANFPEDFRVDVLADVDTSTGEVIPHKPVTISEFLDIAQQISRAQSSEVDNA